MELNKFIENFASLFEEMDAASFKSETAFKELDDWSSLIALSIIAMVDEEYNVVIKGDDIRKAKTIEDLFNIIKSQK